MAGGQPRGQLAFPGSLGPPGSRPASLSGWTLAFKREYFPKHPMTLLRENGDFMDCGDTIPSQPGSVGEETAGQRAAPGGVLGPGRPSAVVPEGLATSMCRFYPEKSRSHTPVTREGAVGDLNVERGATSPPRVAQLLSSRPPWLPEARPLPTPRCTSAGCPTARPPVPTATPSCPRRGHISQSTACSEATSPRRCSQTLGWGPPVAPSQAPGVAFGPLLTLLPGSATHTQRVGVVGVFTKLPCPLLATETAG